MGWWNPGTDQEIFSMEELIEKFDIRKVQKKGGIFNIEKLRWINKEYIKLQKNNTEERINQKLKENVTLYDELWQKGINLKDDAKDLGDDARDAHDKASRLEGLYYSIIDELAKEN